MAREYPDRRIAVKQKHSPGMEADLPEVGRDAATGREERAAINADLPEAGQGNLPVQGLPRVGIDPELPPQSPIAQPAQRVQPPSVTPDLPEAGREAGRTGAKRVPGMPPDLPDVAQASRSQSPERTPNLQADLPEVVRPIKQDPVRPVQVTPDLPEVVRPIKQDPIQRPTLAPDLPEAEPRRVVRPTPPLPSINPELPATADADRDLRFQTNFDGAWVPDWSGLNAGPKNYQTQRNLRYRPDGLEGIDGTTRINTASTGKLLKAGIQLRTPYSQESYVVAQGEDSDGSDRVLLVNETDVPSAGGFNGASTLTVSLGSDEIVLNSTAGGVTSANQTISIPADTYTGNGLADAITTALNAATDLVQSILVFSCVYKGRRFIITTTGGTCAYVDTGSTIGDTIGFTTDQATSATLTGDTDVDVITASYTENASASRARFAKLPSGHIGICDGVENLIWAGDEMPVGGFFAGTLTSPTLSIFKRDLKDYTERVNNALADSANSVDLHSWYYNYNHYFVMTTRPIQGMTLDITPDVSGDTHYFLTANNNLQFKYDGGASTAVALSGLTNATWYTSTEMANELKTRLDAAFSATFTVAMDTSTGLFGVVAPDGHTIQYIDTDSTGGEYFGFNVDSVALQITTSAFAPCYASVYYWDGNSFDDATVVTDTTRANGKSLQQDGKISWDSTAITPIPVLVNGYYLYCYVLRVWNGKASLHNLTVDAPIQEARDIWDGQLRTCISFVVDRAATGDDSDMLKTSKYEDFTLEVADKSYASTPLGAHIGGLANTEFCVAIFEERQAALRLGVNERHRNLDAATISVSYWNGTAWTACTGEVDFTLDSGGTISVSQSGFVTWDAVSESDEVPYTYRGVTGYAYKINWSATLEYQGSNSQKHRETVQLDEVKGVPAYRVIDKAYSFMHMHRDRLMLCGCVSDEQKNRVDYSSKYRPDVLNGEDSSGDKNQLSLYFGSADPLTAAAELFNQFSDGLDSVSIFTKATETYVLSGDAPTEFKVRTLSHSIGCPSPHTLDTAEITLGSTRQNIAIWMDGNLGPVISNGGTIVPIADDFVKRYWTPGSDYAIPAAYLSLCAGKVDPNWNEYNLLIPSGSSATANNVWLVYDLVRKKWRENHLGDCDDFPQNFVRVEDNYGNKHIYALTDTGYTLRCDNGRTWSDGTAITYTVKTGDALFTESAWDEVEARRLKVMFAANAEGSMTINHYLDGDDTATAITSSATPRLGTAFAMSRTGGHSYRNLIMQLAKTTSGAQHSLRGLSHAFEFIVTGCTATKPKLLGWGCQYAPVREDTFDMG